MHLLWRRVERQRRPQTCHPEGAKTKKVVIISAEKNKSVVRQLCVQRSRH